MRRLNVKKLSPIHIPPPSPPPLRPVRLMIGSPSTWHRGLVRAETDQWSVPWEDTTAPYDSVPVCELYGTPCVGGHRVTGVRVTTSFKVKYGARVLRA